MITNRGYFTAILFFIVLVFSVSAIYVYVGKPILANNLTNAYVNLTPSLVVNMTNLRCSYSNLTANATGGYYVDWFRNGVFNKTVRNSTYLNNYVLRKGDAWSCTVKATNVTSNSTAVRSKDKYWIDTALADWDKGTTYNTNISNSNSKGNLTIDVRGEPPISMSGLLAYWKFSNSSTKQKNDGGTQSDNVTLQNSAFTTAGFHGGGLSLTAIAATANVSSWQRYRFNSANMTYIAWVYLNNVTGVIGLFDFALTANVNQPALYLKYGTNGPMAYFGGSNYRYFTAPTYSKKWYMVAFQTFGNTSGAINQSKIYVNGRNMAATSTAQAAPLTASRRLWLGTMLGAGNSMDANITLDSVMIFNRTLSAKEIEYLFNHTYWKTANYTSGVIDTGGNANTTKLYFNAKQNSTRNITLQVRSGETSKVLFFDDFDSYADGADASSFTETTPGTNWLVNNGTYFGSATATRYAAINGNFSDFLMEYDFIVYYTTVSPIYLFARYKDASNYFRFLFPNTASNIAAQEVEGAVTVNTASATKIIPSGVWHTTKVLFNGTNYKYKVWPRHVTEPSSWDISEPVLRHNVTSGKIELMTTSGTDGVKFDNIKITSLKGTTETYGQPTNLSWSEWSGPDYTHECKSIARCALAYDFSDISVKANKTYDLSKFNHTGVIYNAWQTPAGFHGEGMSFNGESYIQVSDSKYLDLNGSWSIEAWVRPSRETAEETILQKAGAGSAPRISVMSNGTVRYNDGVASLDAGSLAASRWSHIVITSELLVNRSRIVIWANGAIADTGNSTDVDVFVNANDLMIGKSAGTASFNGTLDSVIIYNSTIANRTIIDHYDNRFTAKGQVIGSPNRFLQYRVFLNTSDTNKTPYLEDVYIKQTNYTKAVYNTPPETPTIIGPKNKTYMFDTTPIFSWYGSPDRDNRIDNLSINRTGLLVYLKFDENSGTKSYDQSGKGNNATIINAGWGSEALGYSGIYLNGTGYGAGTSLLTIPKTNGIDNFTIMMWYKRASINSVVDLFCTYNYYPLEMGFAPTSVYVHMKLKNGTVLSNIISGGYLTKLNTWEHITITYNGSNVVLYKDGVIKQTSVLAKGKLDNFTYISDIGQQFGGVRHFNGTIDEFMLYNRSLTAAEVSDIYALSDPYRNKTYSDRQYYELLVDNDSDFSSPKVTWLSANNFSSPRDVSPQYSNDDPYTLLVQHFESLDEVKENGGPNTASMKNYTTDSGVLGKAAVFHSPGVNVSYSPKGNIISDRGTVEFWYKSTGKSSGKNRQVFYAGSSTGSNRLSLSTESASSDFRFVIQQANGTTHNVSSAVNIDDSRWHHVMAVWDLNNTLEGGKRLELYVDGKNLSNTYANAKQNIRWSGPTRLQVGQDIGSIQVCNCSIDELRISSIPRLPLIDHNLTSFDLTGKGVNLSNGGTYYWKVRSFNKDDRDQPDESSYSLWSVVRELYITNTPPVIGSWFLPANATWFNVTTVNFNFTVTEDYFPANCTLWLNSSGTFVANTTRAYTTGTNNISFPKIMKDGEFRWNVKCNNSAGQTAWLFTNYNRTIFVDSHAPVVILKNITFQNLSNSGQRLKFNTSNLTENPIPTGQQVNFTLNVTSYKNTAKQPNTALKVVLYVWRTVRSAAATVYQTTMTWLFGDWWRASFTINESLQHVTNWTIFVSDIASNVSISGNLSIDFNPRINGTYLTRQNDKLTPLYVNNSLNSSYIEFRDPDNNKVAVRFKLYINGTRNTTLGTDFERNGLIDTNFIGKGRQVRIEGIPYDLLGQNGSTMSSKDRLVVDTSRTDWDKGTNYKTNISATNQNGNITINPYGAPPTTGTGLLAYWTFNNASTKQKSLVGQDNATAINSPIYNPDCYHDGCFKVGNKATYFNVSNFQKYNINSNKTWIAWVNANTTTDNARPIFGLSANSGLYHDLIGIGFFVQTGTANYQFHTIPGGFKTGWHMIAFQTYGNTSGSINQSKVYYDGKLAAASTINYGVTAPNTGLRLGYDGSRGYNGSIDTVMIYNRTLSAKEIEYLFNHTYWKHANYTSSVIDLGENANMTKLIYNAKHNASQNISFQVRSGETNKVLFFEDFDSYADGTDPGTFQELAGTWSVSNGTYQGFPAAGWTNTLIRGNFSNYLLEYEIRPYPTSSGNQYYVGAIFGYKDTNNYYMYSAPYEQSEYLYELVGGVWDPLDLITNDLANENWYKYKLMVNGTIFKTKMWLKHNTEPTAWSMTQSPDGENRTRGRVGFTIHSTGLTKALYDNIKITALKGTSENYTSWSQWSGEDPTASCKSNSGCVLGLDFAKAIGNKTYDQSRYNNTGILKQGDCSSTSPGYHGRGLYCLGKLGGVQVSDSASLDLNGSFTFEGYFFNNQTISTRAVLFYKGDGGATPAISVLNNEGIRVSADQTIDFAIGAVSENKWHHIVIVFKNISTTKSIVYGAIDGVFYSAAANLTDLDIWHNPNPLRIGSDAAKAVDEWNGYMDSVMIYNYALSNATIRSHAKNRITASGELIGSHNRFLQYRVLMNTSNQNETPVLESVNILQTNYTQVVYNTPSETPNPLQPRNRTYTFDTSPIFAWYGSPDRDNRIDNNSINYTDLLVYWKLDENTGTLARDKGNGRGDNGTISGSFEWSEGIGYSGLYSNASTWNSVHANLNTFYPGRGYTALIWIKRNNAKQTNYQDVLQVGPTVSDSGKLHIYNNAACWYGALYNLSACELSTPVNTSWTQIVLRWNTTNATIYKNGGQKASANIKNSKFNISLIALGQVASLEVFNGSVDEVMLYNRTLKESEIKTLYRLGDRYKNKSSSDRQYYELLVDNDSNFESPKVAWLTENNFSSTRDASPQYSEDDTYTLLVEHFESIEAIQSNKGGLKNYTADFGISGNAAVFHSPGVNVSYSPKGNIISDRGTVEFWYKSTGKSSGKNRQVFYAGSSTGSNRLSLSTESASSDFRLVIQQANGTTHNVSSAVNIDDSRWHHVMAVWDLNNTLEGGKRLELYVDGKNLSNTYANAKQNIRWSGPTRLQVGQDIGSTKVCNCSIDELRISSIPRTPVTQHNTTTYDMTNKGVNLTGGRWYWKVRSVNKDDRDQPDENIYSSWSKVRELFIDTTPPVITWSVPATLNNTIVGGRWNSSFNLSIGVSDVNLYIMNVSIWNGTKKKEYGWQINLNATTGVDTSYTMRQRLYLTNATRKWTTGWYKVQTLVSDLS